MKSNQPDRKKMIEETWYELLTKGYSLEAFRYRRLFSRLPSNPRCRICNAPFQGIGARILRMSIDLRQSSLNPNLCNSCEKFAAEYQGGAEVDLTLLFADVRGSTTLAESMSAFQYSQMINRFYNSVTQVLIQADALLNRLTGDLVVGIFVPGFAGPEHAQRAIWAAQEIMKVTGHPDPERVWIPLGIGIYSGPAFFGSVGSKDGTIEIAVLGDAANTAARLSSTAADGEILVSETAWERAALKTPNPEKRLLTLKGKHEPVAAFALTTYASLQR